MDPSCFTVPEGMPTPASMAAMFGGAIPPLPANFPRPSPEQLQQFLAAMRSKSPFAALPVQAQASPVIEASVPRGALGPAPKPPRVNARGNWTPEEVGCLIALV